MVTVTIPTRRHIVRVGPAKMTAAATAKMAGIEPMVPELVHSRGVECLCIASDWQDISGSPGWDMASGTFLPQKTIAGYLRPMALADGGYVHILMGGTFDANSINPSLLVQCKLVQDFYSASPTTSLVCPTPGWGFTNSQTGSGTLGTMSGSWLLDVRLISLGQFASPNTIWSKGSLEFTDGTGDDGDQPTPSSTQIVYRIDKRYNIDLEPEYNICMDAGVAVSSSGADDWHMDFGGIWLYGSRIGTQGGY